MFKSNPDWSETGPSQQTHEMRLEKTYAAGAEEWYCPACGRRFIMQWLPDYKKFVLEPGDEYAIHSATKGGLRLGSLQAKIEEKEDLSEEHLRPWLEGFEEIDFGDL